MMYIALLRGINVGGNTKVSMDGLKRVFTSFGYTNVRTILNSGNVLFDVDETDQTTLSHTIESIIEQQFGFPVRVLLRTGAEIQELIQLDPFRQVNCTPDTRLYVTFFQDSNTSQASHSPQTPYEFESGGVRIFQVSKRELCSVITLSQQGGTTDLMSLLDKEYGKNITTRNWNTVVRIEKMVG